VLKAFEDQLILGRHRRRFQKGETIYFEGDSADTWFEVAKGVARTCRYHSDGHRQLTGFHYAGDVFGLEEGLRLESAEAVTDMICWSIAKPTGEAYVGDEGCLTAEHDRALGKALESANRCIFLFGRRTAPQRLAAFLLMTADQLEVNSDVDLPMCRTDIADYLGLTIHTVSRTITQLCDDSLISLMGAQHCRIVDRPGLTALAGGTGPLRAGVESPAPLLML
jgi:CRP-like cAMP-binding protein